MEFVLENIGIIGIWVILALSLNVICGMTGLLHLGHAGFYAIGAYSAALVSIYWFHPEWGFFNFIISAVVAVVVACVFAILIGVPCLRLRGDYLAIATLGFGEIIRITLNLLTYPDIEKQTDIQAQLAAGDISQEVAAMDMESATIGGATGLEMPIESLFMNPAIIWGFVLVVFILLILLKRSTIGRAFLAIRENEIAAQAMGVNVSYYKILSFVVCAAFAGFAGAVFAHFRDAINPNDFSLLISINILLIVVLGGLGSFSGSLLAAVILVGLPEGLRLIPVLFNNAEGVAPITSWIAENKELIFAFLLIVMIRLVPNGLFGLKEGDEVIKQLLKRKKKPVEVDND